jgi:hypothetical protein
LLVNEREVFLAFKDFPWFREATVREITNVELPSPHHLYWPDLDVDLAVESIDVPQKYPMVSRVLPDRRRRRPQLVDHQEAPKPARLSVEHLSDCM